MISEAWPDGSVIHFVYIKPQFKKMGIAKKLFEASKLQETQFFTHWTFDVDELTQKLPNLTYDPYRI